MKAGKVCAACARLGWLLVLGADAPDTPASVRRKARAASRAIHGFIRSSSPSSSSSRTRRDYTPGMFRGGRS